MQRRSCGEGAEAVMEVAQRAAGSLAAEGS